MLNETSELSVSMKAAGIVADSWFNNYKKLPNYKTYFMFIGADGSIVDLEPIADKQRIKSIRKWEIPNQGISFPAFSIPPLFHAKSKEAQESTDMLKKMLKTGAHIEEDALSLQLERIGQICDPIWIKAEIGRIDKCLQSQSKRLANILGDVPGDCKAIRELTRRAESLNASKLGDSIKSAVIRHIRKSPDDAKDWLDALIVTTAKNVKQVTLVPEITDISSFKYPVNHERVQIWINSRLMSNDKPNLPAHTVAGQDAFGQPFAKKDSDAKFPEVRLPVLGNVKLRSMNKESPCQARYKHTDSESFPAGTGVRQAMKDSLEWLSDPSRKGKTWEDLSGACGFTKREGRTVPIAAILLAYPSILPGDPPELAGAFGGEGQPGDAEGAKFEKCAERVTAALNISVKEHPETEIRVFVLAKADKARTKLLVSRRYEAKQIITAAQTWLQGCRNIPDIRLNLGTDDKPDWHTPYAPFPAEFVKCLNVAWLHGGTTSHTVHGLNIGEGLCLFMETNARALGTIERSLQLAISNACPLLLAIGHADHRRDKPFKLSGYPKHTSLLPSLLGLLLYKLNYTKGGYMSSSPFLVGQMLALADTLHKEYCQHVRKGELPPQLIGNALMPTALENPTAGLARLSERFAPYQAWANTAMGDGVGLAKWALQQFQHVAGELGKQTLPEQCNDADKAQMLLGYLAHIEGKTPNLETN